MATKSRKDRKIREIISTVGYVVRRYIYNRTEAEDVIQDVLLKLLTKGYFQEQHTQSWLCAVIRNAAFDHMRKQARETDGYSLVHVNSTGVYDHSEFYGINPPCCAVVAEPDLMPAIDGALGRLPKAASLSLVLKCDGYSYGEIATITGANIGTVRSRIHYARKQARELLAAFA